MFKEKKAGAPRPDIAKKKDATFCCPSSSKGNKKYIVKIPE
jgi:hypothetical protein